MRVLLEAVSAIDEESDEQVVVKKFKNDFIQTYQDGSTAPVEGNVYYELQDKEIRIDGEDPSYFVDGDKRYRHNMTA